MLYFDKEVLIERKYNVRRFLVKTNLQGALSKIKSRYGKFFIYASIKDFDNVRLKTKYGNILTYKQGVYYDVFSRVKVEFIDYQEECVLIKMPSNIFGFDYEAFQTTYNVELI